MKYSFLLLSGGVGARSKLNAPKQYVHLNGIEMLLYSLLAIKNIENISEIIINYPENGLIKLEEIVLASGLKDKVNYVRAGATRQESVLLMLDEATEDNVIIHEAARPIVDEKLFHKLIEAEHDNVSFMCPIPFTVAPVNVDNGLVTGSLDRNLLRNVQLPQKFLKSSLIDAHRWAKENQLPFTEDGCLLAEFKEKVYFIDGASENMKVTDPLDIYIAETFLKKLQQRG